LIPLNKSQCLRTSIGSRKARASCLETGKASGCCLSGKSLSLTLRLDALIAYQARKETA
jgi:hypothetical protein